ncbi:MAG: MFS transporter [Spirochaetes bacterium]|nr:MFS transporter [Spirochaetota bacterium]
MHPDTQKSAALTAALVSSFLTPFMGSSLTVALPTIGRQFHLDALSLNWVLTAYLLAAGMFLVPFGRLSDIVGRKKIYIIGIISYAVLSVVTAYAPTGTLFIAMRFIQGISGAMIFGTGMTILVSVFPPEERGRALGLNVASVYLGASLGPLFGGLMTQYIGWQSIFIVNAALGLVAAAVVFLKLKGEWAQARGERFDIPGSLLYAVSLLLLIVGFSRLPHPTAWAIIAVSIAGITAFILYTTRVKEPVIDLKLFIGNRPFSFAVSGALINYSATFAVGFLVSLYLQYIKGFTPGQAGLMLLVQPVIQTVFSPFAGRLSDKRPPDGIAAFGMGLTALGLFILVFTGTDTPFWLIITALAILGLGFAFFSSPNTTAAMHAVAARSYGVASSIVGTMRLIGQIFSMGIVMIVFALFLHGVRVTPVYHPQFLAAMRILIIIFTVVCAAGTLLRTSGRNAAPR